MLLQYGTKPLADEDDKVEGKMLGIALTPAPTPTPRDSAKAVPATKPVAASVPEYVLSGMVRNPDVITGQGAIFDVPLGKGHVIAFTFNPLHRWCTESRCSSRLGR